MKLEDKILKRVVPAKALPRLKNMLNGYMSQWEEVYLGATSNPDLRRDQHLNGGWRKMVLLYEAFSPEIARGMERELIAHLHAANFRTRVGNANAGGEGLSDEQRSNFLYLLCR